MNGRTPKTAFIIKDSKGEITPTMRSILDGMFGDRDGDYFTHTESTIDNKEDGHRYKVMYLEDKQGNKHTIYFRIG